MEWHSTWKIVARFLDVLDALRLKTVWQEDEDSANIPGFLERRNIARQPD